MLIHCEHGKDQLILHAPIAIRRDDKERHGRRAEATEPGQDADHEDLVQRTAQSGLSPRS